MTTTAARRETTADGQVQHELLAVPDHDELARHNFIRTVKSLISSELTPSARTVWTERVLPDFITRTGRGPKDRHEVREAMDADLYIRFWNAIRRTTQELLWDNTAGIVGRQLPEIADRSAQTPSAGGTLTIDPGFVVPEYLKVVDIHCMPSGYHDADPDTVDDLFSGAMYDRGVYVYAQSQLGPLNDDYGQSMIDNFLTARHPDFRPRRILEIGCTVGHSTLPFKEHFPEAEVYGIDAAAPVVRYAHARAEALGVPVHFSQQNAERTDFDDGFFDLIVSHIVLHETSADAVPRILAECHRLLAPGGIMAHADVPQYEGMEVFAQYLLDWDTYNNNELFWGELHDMDLEELTRRAGFPAESVETVVIPTGRRLENLKSKGGLSLTVAIRE